MKAESFAYWLQGFFEISNMAPGTPMTGDQVDQLRKHLNMVFYHDIDPSLGKDREALQQMHDTPKRVAPVVSFEGDTKTLEQLFGKEPVTMSQVMEVFSAYFMIKQTEQVLKEPAAEATPPRTPPYPRPGMPPRSHPWDSGGPKITC